jgi:hypothetical protein
MFDETDFVPEWLEGARDFYRKAGIPAGAREWLRTRDGKWHPKPAKVRIEDVDLVSLEEDLWRHHGFKERSREHYAGMVILGAHQVLYARQNGGDTELGAAILRLSNARNDLAKKIIAARDGARGGRKSKRKEWAHQLARHLRKEGGTFENAWLKIPVDGGAIQGFVDQIDDFDAQSIYREGDTVTATFDGSADQPLKKSTFQRKYWQQAGR